MFLSKMHVCKKYTFFFLFTKIHIYQKNSSLCMEFWSSIQNANREKILFRLNLIWLMDWCYWKLIWVSEWNWCCRTNYIKILIDFRMNEEIQPRNPTFVLSIRLHGVDPLPALGQPTCVTSTSPTLKASSTCEADISWDTVQGIICVARVL